LNKMEHCSLKIMEEKYQYPYIKHKQLSKTAHSLAPFKANADVPQPSY
jgi:hypothetical protein